MSALFEVSLTFDVFAQSPEDAARVFLETVRSGQVETLSFAVSHGGGDVEVCDVAVSPQHPKRHLKAVPSPVESPAAPASSATP